MLQVTLSQYRLEAGTAPQVLQDAAMAAALQALPPGVAGDEEPGPEEQAQTPAGGQGIEPQAGELKQPKEETEDQPVGPERPPPPQTTQGGDIDQSPLEAEVADLLASTLPHSAGGTSAAPFSGFSAGSGGSLPTSFGTLEVSSWAQTLPAHLTTAEAT